MADQKARVFIAELLVQCGADPDNRQHGCGGTPLHHTRASTSNVPRLWEDLGLLRGARLALGRSAHSGGSPRPTATVRRRPVAGSKPPLQSPLSTHQAGWRLSRARQVPAECGRRRQRLQPIRCAPPRLLPLLSPQPPTHMPVSNAPGRGRGGGEGVARWCQCRTGCAARWRAGARRLCARTPHARALCACAPDASALDAHAPDARGTQACTRCTSRSSVSTRSASSS